MNILMLSHYFWPHRGGVEKHLELLSMELLKKHHSITVVTEQHDPLIPNEEFYKGIRIIRIPHFATKSKRMTWMWMSKHDYLIDEADVVHIHDVYWWYWPSRLAWLLKPVYVTFHGYEGVNPPTWRAVVQRKLAECVSCGSICIGDFMRKWYLASPTKVSYGAASVEQVKNRNSIGNEALFVGRYDYDTGIDLYIEAMKKIRIISRLDCYGDGPLLDFIKILIKDKRIYIHPWDEKVGEKISRCRFLFVSRYLSILEGMRGKRLVVAVYNNEIKRDYLLCHPMHDNMIIAGTADELADKMNDIMVHPEKERLMIERAYTWAKEQTWEKLADQYEKLWAR